MQFKFTGSSARRLRRGGVKKNSPQVRPEDLRGLKSFGEDFPESRRWLLYRGRERLLRDGILCMPCEEFLPELKPGEFPL